MIKYAPRFTFLWVPSCWSCDAYHYSMKHLFGSLGHTYFLKPWTRHFGLDYKWCLSNSHPHPHPPRHTYTNTHQIAQNYQSTHFLKKNHPFLFISFRPTVLHLVLPTRHTYELNENFINPSCFLCFFIFVFLWLKWLFVSNETRFPWTYEVVSQYYIRSKCKT